MEPLFSIETTIYQCDRCDGTGNHVVNGKKVSCDACDGYGYTGEWVNRYGRLCEQISFIDLEISRKQIRAFVESNLQANNVRMEVDTERMATEYALSQREMHDPMFWHEREVERVVNYLKVHPNVIRYAQKAWELACDEFTGNGEQLSIELYDDHLECGEESHLNIVVRCEDYGESHFEQGKLVTRSVYDRIEKVHVQLDDIPGYQISEWFLITSMFNDPIPYPVAWDEVNPFRE